MILEDLRDIVSRAHAVIVNSDHADEHAELIRELLEVVSVLDDAAMTTGEIVIPGGQQ